MDDRTFAAYFQTLDRLAASIEASQMNGESLSGGEAVSRVHRLARSAHDAGGKLMFIGNGGSAGIVSHCAIDYSKNGGLRAMAFNDPAALTCLGNDYGYDNVFSRQVEMMAQPGDLLMAISSSGSSMNIRKAVEAARERSCEVVTFSGFKADNPLRGMGTVNFYVPSMEYGFVEILHLAVCHAILDLFRGWTAQSADMKEGVA